MNTFCVETQIQPDSDFGKSIGFTKDKFSGYLWHEGDRLLIDVIVSKYPRMGNFSRLIQAIEDRGLRVAVSNPLMSMQLILMAKGFIPHLEESFFGSKVEVWEKPRCCKTET